jgi:micrococcal nuclease
MTRIFTAAALLWFVSTTAVLGQEVTKVVNGETIELEGIGRIRLVGIDADEQALRLGPTGPPAPPRTDPPNRPPPPLITGSVGVKPDSAARDFLQLLVLGKRVRLEYDEAASKGRGPRRAYVYLDDDTLVNEEMLESGHARVDTSRPFGRLKQFQEIEATARDAHRGIWAEPSRR